MRQLFTLLFSLSCFLTLSAQSNVNSSPIIFIYDASGSMWGQLDGQTKMELAATVLSNTLDKLPADQRIGLVAYGHRREKDCDDIEFLIDMENTSKEQVRQAVKKIKPLGRTPLAKSALKVIDQLRKSKAKATIILVTDGIEVCNGNLCDVIRQAKAEGIDFKLHVIGFGLKEAETGPLRCAAAAGDGKYHTAADAISLSQGLEEATTTTIDSIAFIKPLDSEKNFSVYAVKNGEPIDVLVEAFKAETDEVVSSTRTYKDTSFLNLLPGKYDLKFTLISGDVEAIIAYKVESIPDSIGHKTMSFDAGAINVRTTNNGEGWDSVVKIYSSTTGKVVGGSRTYGRSNMTELNPGNYDVEMTALKLNGPAIKYRVENILVIGNDTSEVTHDFNSGTLTVLSTNNGEGWDSVVKVTAKANGKGIAGGRTYGKPHSYLINPGIYEIEFAAMRLSGLEQKSQVETIEVKTGEEITINHNFKSGILRIGAKASGNLTDAMVKVQEIKSGKYFSGGRTYGAASSNPKEMILSPAIYLILVKDLKSGKQKEFTVTLDAGETIEKMVEF